jgi:predicted metal-dependent hydrolase
MSNRENSYKKAEKTTASGLTFEAVSEGISYTIRKRKQAKRMVLRVSADGRVWVSMPLRGAVKDAEAFFAKNIDFVRSSLAKVSENMPTPQPQSPHSSSAKTLELPLEGVWYPVVITVRETFSMEFFPTHVLFSIPLEYTADEATMRSQALKYWHYRMITHANETLPKRTQEFAARLGETVIRIAIKDQRSLWGSCVKSRRSINLNWRSILFPAEVRDYLIIHELAHLRHSNHSAAYWQHVQECCTKAGLQDFRLSEQWIKKNGRRIMGLRTLLQDKRRAV